MLLTQSRLCLNSPMTSLFLISFKDDKRRWLITATAMTLRK